MASSNQQLERAPFPITSMVPPQPGVGAMTQVEQSRAIMQVQAQIISAKQFPRNEDAVFQKVAEACKRRGLAESALYEFPRGGQKVEGPSIRLAETLSRYWGNLDFGIRELEQQKGKSIMEAYCHDLETNVRQSRIFHVEHVRDKKSGNEVLSSGRDIYENNANNGARRLRACILGVIPSELVDEAVRIVRETLQSDPRSLAERVKLMLESFAEHGVSKEMIEQRLRHKIEAISEPELLNLRKVFISIKDGFGGPEDYFTNDQPKKNLTATQQPTVTAKTIGSATIETKPEPQAEIVVEENAEFDFEAGEFEDEPQAPAERPREMVVAEYKAACKEKGLTTQAKMSAVLKEKFPNGLAVNSASIADLEQAITLVKGAK